jgi:hypothetical protein
LDHVKEGAADVEKLFDLHTPHVTKTWVRMTITSLVSNVMFFSDRNFRRPGWRRLVRRLFRDPLDPWIGHSTVFIFYCTKILLMAQYYLLVADEH